MLACACTIVIVLAAGHAMAGGNDDPEPQPDRPYVNDLAWNIMDVLDEENIVLSPYSIYTALGMLLNGAEPGSSTEKELADVLGVKGAGESNDYLEYVKKLLPKASDQLGLRIANMILVDSSILNEPNTEINNEFRRIITEYYEGEIDEADFANDVESVREFIRAWVEEKTEGMIPDYESVAKETTVTDLLNVIYLKSSWKYPFQEGSSFKTQFHNRDGSVSSVDMMKRTFGHQIKYYEDSKYRGVELPYNVEGERGLAMYVILPKDPSRTDVLESWCNESADYRESFLTALRSSGNARSIKVLLPSFEAENEYDLCKILEKLGMSVSFTDGAEYTRILDGQVLHVGSGKHQAKITVDENGTEAAAVTEIVMEKNSGSIGFNETIDFRCDIPFIYTISETTEGTDLFIGCVNSL